MLKHCGYSLLALMTIVGVSATSSGRVAAENAVSPLSPDAERATFRLADNDLVVELVAAEPDVVSPVSIAWDEDGRMYVAEMRDYPNATTGGCVKRLDDPDECGRYRRATIFADKLAFPNSVLPWSGGVLVTSAPNIWFFKDTDGDGKADEKRVILTGFHTGNQQLRVNGLTWGLDNWVYGANGRSGGAIHKPGEPPEKAVSIARSDFRFRPDTGPVEAVAGFSQFGQSRDDWGNRFTNWNTIPMRHVVIDERYLSRNPYLAEAKSVATIADPADLRVYSISPPPQTFNREPVTFFNASCGLTVFRGHLLGEKYQGNAFVCEPLTNLVHRRVLKPAGATFVAQRAEQGKEFLAATDPWFHPVNLTTGPDGALYICDFYRKWVEHPDFVPEKLRGKIDWRTGVEHGRIWRIRKKDMKPEPPPRLRSAKSAQLVETLNHPNGWRRDTAQRLLLQRDDKPAVPQLRELVSARKSPQACVHALWTLQALDGLDSSVLFTALENPNPRVREQAVRLCEGRSTYFIEAIRKLAADPDTRVRFQCALALGELRDKDSIGLRVTIAARDTADEWTRLALLCGLDVAALPFMQELLKQHGDWLSRPTAAQTEFLAQVGKIIGARNRDAELVACVNLLSDSDTEAAPGRLAILAGLAEGLARTKRPLQVLLAKPPASLQQRVRALEPLFRSARQIAMAEHEEPARRVLAIQLLIRARPEAITKSLSDLLQPRQPQPVQFAAARGIGEVADKTLAGSILDHWGTYTTSTRRELQTALLQSPALALALLDAVEQEKIAAAELDPATQAALQRIPDTALRTRAAKLLSKAISADRQAVVRKYESALTLAGDGGRGAALFAKNCLICHQMQGQGHAVGPDLSGVGSQPKEALLNDILDPSREVSGDYLNYVLVTKRGQVLTGLLASETANSVRLRRAEGAEDTVLRSEIEDLRLTGKSLMPEGLEQTLSVRDVADILEFLQHPSALPSPAKK